MCGGRCWSIRGGDECRRTDGPAGRRIIIVVICFGSEPSAVGASGVLTPSDDAGGGYCCSIICNIILYAYTYTTAAAEVQPSRFVRIKSVYFLTPLRLSYKL